MKTILRNVIGVVLGIIVGGAVNMGIITVSGDIIPLPEGIDPNNVESLKANMHLFEPRHFVFPFLAHALGTMAGALVAAAITETHKMRFALAVGIFFLVGGIAAVYMLPAPLWFSVVDLTMAYLPMAWIGGRIILRFT